MASWNSGTHEEIIEEEIWSDKDERESAEFVAFYRNFENVLLFDAQNKEKGLNVSDNSLVEGYLGYLSQKSPFERKKDIDTRFENANEDFIKGRPREPLDEALFGYVGMQITSYTAQFESLMLDYVNKDGEEREKMAASLPNRLVETINDVSQNMTVSRQSLTEFLQSQPDFKGDIVQGMIELQAQSIDRELKKPARHDDLPERMVAMAEACEEGNWRVQNDPKLETVINLIIAMPKNKRNEYADSMCDGRFGGLPKEILRQKLTNQENEMERGASEKAVLKKGLHDNFRKNLDIAASKIIDPQEVTPLDKTRRDVLLDNLCAMPELGKNGKFKKYYNSNALNETNPVLKKVIEYLGEYDAKSGDRRNRANELISTSDQTACALEKMCNDHLEKVKKMQSDRER